MKSVFKTLDRNRPRKMVFYGRVSTEHEAQLAALKNQMQWYDDQERYHPNWTVVDRYIDGSSIVGLSQKELAKQVFSDLVQLFSHFTTL